MPPQAGLPIRGPFCPKIACSAAMVKSQKYAIWLEDLALQPAFLLPVHVAPGTERLVPGSGEDDHADLGVRTRALDG